MPQRDFSHLPAASIASRLIAVIIDSLLIAVAFGLGLFLTFQLVALRLMEDPRSSKTLRPTSIIILVSIVGLLCIGQWILLSTQGQTIGKKVMMIRIVSIRGRLPGFVQAVVLRNWLRHLLGMIPFFVLIDLLFGLGDGHRCIHDWLSGTRVVADC